MNEFFTTVLLDGWLAHDAGITVNRVAVGLFFAISGWHKLTVKARHESLVRTLEADGIPFVRFNAWFVPSVEFINGLLLMVGFLTVFSAWLLMTICVVAACTDGIPSIKDRFHPINRLDYLDDILYLPEVLYALQLVAVLAGGPGVYSLDFLIWR